MYLGNCVWNFRSLRLGAPWEEAIEACARTGVPGIELILCTPEELNAYWTTSRCDELRRLIEMRGLSLSQYALFQPASGDLASLDGEVRGHALKVFEGACKVAVRLGAPLINFVAPWPIGIEAPIPYVPRYFYVDNVGGEPKMALKLPPGFDWEALWATYVQTIRLCVEAAKAEGLKLSLEGHLHVMSPGTDSLLRLADHIGDDAFGFNMDIGWHALQREDIGWAIHKMGRRLLSVHIRDVDGFGLHFTAPGLGCLDWPGIVQALKSIGYQGALNLELSEYKDRERIAAWSFEYMRRVLAGEKSD